MLQADMFGNYGGNKRCVCCGKVKEAFEFNASKISSDGLQSYCKECQKAYRKKHPNKEFKKNRKDNHSLNLFQYEKDTR